MVASTLIGTKKQLHLAELSKNLINRVLTISDECFHTQNKTKIMNILIDNNFPYNLTKHLISSYKPIESIRNRDNNEPKIYKSLTYIPNISERIVKSNICDTKSYNIAHQTNNNLNKLFSNTKDKIPNMEKSNIVYQISCEGNHIDKCKMLYVGTTKNKLKTRLTGHKSDIKIRNNSHTYKTALAAHCARENHHPNLNNVRILERENHYNKRLTLETLHINNVPTTKRINFKTDTENITHTYKNLIRKRGKRIGARSTRKRS